MADTVIHDSYDSKYAGAAERRRDRLEQHADRLLRQVLKRTRINLEDREKIARFLEGVVSVDVLYRTSLPHDPK